MGSAEDDRVAREPGDSRNLGDRFAPRQHGDVLAEQGDRNRRGLRRGPGDPILIGAATHGRRCGPSNSGTADLSRPGGAPMPSDYREM
jgi:hypothetical protein